MGAILNKQNIRQHFRDTLSKISEFGWELLGLAEHGEFGLNEAAQRSIVQAKAVAATDALLALVSLTPATEALKAPVREAVANALSDPEAVGSPVLDPETEVFIHEEILRTYASRVGAIYQLDEIDARQGLTRSQSHLVELCENIGLTIAHLVKKGVATEPAREAIVKHHLFATARASFPDAISDGGIKFEGMTASAPDLGVPRLKTCVELKVARGLSDISKAIGQIIDDQSRYGSAEYNNFIAVIYTSDRTVTTASVKAEVAKRQARLGSDPQHGWTWVVAHGPLAPAANLEPHASTAASAGQLDIM